MTWDKSYNTYTDEELKEILAQHKLWLDTEGKGGKRADLSSTVLMRVNFSRANLERANLEKADLFGVNLQQANLHMANLQGASLVGASFMHADLSGANLQNTDLGSAYFVGANTYATNFQGAKNIQTTVGLHFAQSLTELQEKQNQIKRLEQELQQAKQEIEKDKENAQQIEKLQNELSQAKQERDDLENQLETKLDENIEKAQDALSKSLTSADDRIKEYSKNARGIGWGAFGLIALDLFVIIYLGFHYEMFFNLLKEKEIGAWALTLYSFPVLIVFSIAVTLLRHQKKLLDEVRHYSSEKRQIELYSGLLKASQYSAKSLNDPEQSAKYVHETFDKIRDRILSEQSHTNTAGSAVEKEEYEEPLKVLTDAHSKLIDMFTKNKA